MDWQSPKPPASCTSCILDVSPNGHRQSWAPALLVSARPDQQLGFDTELRYTLKGYATTEPTLNVHYLEIPALVRIGSLRDSRSPVVPFLELGPALAVRVHCEVDYANSSNTCRNGAAAGQDWRIRPFDVSAIGGFGLSLRIDDRVAVLGARYDWGLVDIGGGQGAATKNRSTLIYLGWLAPLPRK